MKCVEIKEYQNMRLCIFSKRKHQMLKWVVGWIRQMRSHISTKLTIFLPKNISIVLEMHCEKHNALLLANQS